MLSKRERDDESKTGSLSQSRSATCSNIVVTCFLTYVF